ncbi:MAG TPA: GAF domain-containing protein [Methylomirabilota bacterium]|nr:GAF domain-containing protein [Methylomirabilota bacterium]
MTGEPTAGPPAVHVTPSGLGDIVARLRKILLDAESEDRSRGLLAERDEHALAIFQEILSLPPIGLPPGELFGLAMDRLSRLLAADRALLFVLDEATGRLVPRSGRGVRREEMESVSFDPREGLVGRVFREKRVLTYDAGASSDAADPFVERFPVRQAIAVPVRTEGEVGGVLLAGRQALGAPFTTTDVLLLLVLADRVGSALVHQRLVERQDEHLAEVRELRALMDASRPAREPGEILSRAAATASRLAGVRGAVAIAGEKLADVRAAAGAGLLAHVAVERVAAAPGALAEGFAADGPLVIRDLRSRPGLRIGAIEEEGSRGVLLVPMRSRGRTVGLLCLVDSEARDFAPEHVESAQMLAALTADALETHRTVQGLRASFIERGAREAEQADRDRACTVVTFGAGLTRELTSIFAQLLGKSQLLLARAENDALREALAALQDAAWRGTDVLQRLLALAEAETGVAGRCDLVSVAHEALGFTRTRLPSRPEERGRVEMKAELAPTPPVEGNATALHEIVVNLVLNAMDAMPAGGTLTVRTREHAGGAEISVADRGDGVAPEVHPRIFDPFFTTRPGHLGLGLFVAQAVVRRAGGRIDVRSAAGGTVATVWLPAAAVPSEHAAPAPAAIAESPTSLLEAERTGSILVVEEEESIRTTVMDALMAVGHRVETFLDATTALARLAEGGIDVVITDLALRDRSGLQLAAAVKQRTPHTTVVLMTGWGRRLHEERVRASGVDVMVVKPVQPDRLRAAVAEALAIRRPA